MPLDLRECILLIRMANKTFVLADESLNTYGFWLKMDGADLEQFKRNPIMLWMHMRAWRGTRDEVLPIGYWENIRIENGVLMADSVFDTDDNFAAAIAAKVEKGIIRMASVGITVIETSSDIANLKPGQTRETVTKWKLREASIVDLGANDNALTLAFYDIDGNPLELNSKHGECPVELIRPQTSNQYDMKEVAKLFNLSDNATENDIVQKVKELLDRNATLERKLGEIETREREQRHQRIATLLDQAIRDGRITAEARQSWERMFASNHELAEEALAALPGRKSVKESLSSGKTGKDAEKYAGMTWDELDRKGKLAYLKANLPELYAEKFEEKFGVKPKE